MEHRSGLVVSAVVTHADGYGERVAALAMLDTLPGKHPRTIAADKAYDTRDFRAGVPPAACDAPCSQPQHPLGWQCHRWQNDTPLGLRGQPDHPQAH